MRPAARLRPTDAPNRPFIQRGNRAIRMTRLRLSRLVQLIGLLQAGRQKNADTLASECGVSRRTIFRDLDMLRSAGVPVLFDDDEKRYCIPGSYYLPPTNFTPDEALAVISLCYELGADSRVPFCQAARGAALKLEASLPPGLRESLRDTAGSMRIQLAATNRLDGQESVYRQLLTAAVRRLAVRIQYESLSEDQRIVTKLSPYRLMFSRHSWYVIGRSSMHREVRTFNVGRIRELVQLNDAYEVPARFSIDRYLGNAWHLIPEPGEDSEVVVRFDKLVARNVAEVQWHKTQRCEFLPDGRLEFRVTVSGLHEISWWILGYGDQAEVVAPLKLRELLIGRATRLLNKYRPPEVRAKSKPKRARPRSLARLRKTVN